MIYTRTTVTLVLTATGLSIGAFLDVGPPFIMSVPAFVLAVVAVARTVSALMFGTDT